MSASACQPRPCIILQETLPETLGVYQYLTRATPAQPQPCYVRRQSPDREETLLDMNAVDSEGSLMQVKGNLMHDAFLVGMAG